MSKYTLSRPSRIPWNILLGVLWSALLEQKRDAAEDGKRLLRSLSPEPTVTGLGNLPESGPYVIIANHMNGPGIWVGVAAALIAGTVGDFSRTSVRGVGVNAYRNFRLGNLIPVPDTLTGWLFSRFYAVYDVIVMPHAREPVASRSQAIRKILSSLKKGDVVILFPEGGNVVDFRMRQFRAGVGDLLKMVARLNIYVVPIAIWPVAGTFSIVIGEPLSTSTESSAAAVETDAGRRIAALLPQEYRGAFD